MDFRRTSSSAVHLSLGEEFQVLSVSIFLINCVKTKKTIINLVSTINKDTCRSACYSYNTRLATEDPVLLASWTTLAACSTLGITKITSDRKGNRALILSSVLRFAGWVILSMTAAPRPFFYHWYMPPIAAVTALFIALNSIIS